MNIKKIGSQIFAIVSVALMISGCTMRIAPDDFPRYSILQDFKEQFSYLDFKSNRIAIDCTIENASLSRYCESADGHVSFSLSIQESQPIIKSITVDNTEWSVKELKIVGRVGTEFEDSRRIWIPLLWA